MLETISKSLFWVATALIAYVYLGYPLLLLVLAKLFPQRERHVEQALPRVSMIISAYNEHEVIKEKLENSLALEYPPDLLEILVVSDCSDDGTDDVVKEFSAKRVRLIRQAERLGKSSGLNLAVPNACGDILVFSDANALYETGALKRLLGHFSDSRVGYVVGNARYTAHVGQAPSAASEGLYWRLETWLKCLESRVGSVVGGDGAIYAIRRGLFKSLQPTDINDLLNPLQIIAAGYRGVYDPSAVCYEEAGDSFKKEFYRKVRIVSRSLNAIRRVPAVIFPWTQFRHWLCLVSHKILRWFVPVFLIVLFLTSLSLWHLTLYRAAALSQILFYALAGVAWGLGSRRGASRFLYLPYYFCVVNLASLLGILKCASGSLSPTWKTIRNDKKIEQGKTVLADERRRA
jgi:cellulose synthase/poly-beta-1,6-N-acetylglucosamine synthase-like glycosyltransferase